MIRGRPVHFLLTVLGGWTALRLTMIFSLPVIPAESRRPPTKETGRQEAGMDRPPSSPIERRAIVAPRPRTAQPQRPGNSGGNGWFPTTTDSVPGIQPSFAEAPRPSLALNRFAPGAGLSPAEAGLPRVERSDRWSGSAWMLWRHDDNSASYAFAPRLGGSQAGVRIDYALAPGSPLRPALYGRLSSALQGPAAMEMATGLAIRPRLPIPVIIAVERREGLSEGGRSAFALLAAGGINPVEIGRGFRLDGYAQAGIVGFRQHDGFVDGRLTVERPVAALPTLAIGGSLWGGVQPGVSRLDVGPQASLRLHLGNSVFRLGAEWREQVAGHATPRSGAALTLGTDF